MTPNEIAKDIAEYMRALPATVRVDGAMVTLANDRGTFEIECLSDDKFLIGPSPLRGAIQAEITPTPRVGVDRKELFVRARAWAQ